MVIFGVWGCLGASVNDPGASTSGLIAAGGAIVMIVGIRRAGTSSRVVAKSRAGIGAIGLVVAPIAAVLSFLALATDPLLALGFLLLAVTAVALWAQAIGAQSGLSFGLSVAWLAVAIGFTLIALPEAVVAGTVRDRWSRNRPERQAVLGALRRAVFGKAVPGDADLLARGPRSVLGRQQPPAAGADVRGAALAALDRRLEPVSPEEAPPPRSE